MSPQSKKLKAHLFETAAPSRPGSATPPTRGKVTTKLATKKTALSNNDDGEIVDAMSIRLFCKRHGISPSFFHYLVKVGKGPRTIKLGARTLITIEAAADWRHEREAATVAATRADAAG